MPSSRNPASRYAMTGVFVAKGKDGVRVAVTGAGDERRVPLQGDRGGAGRQLRRRRRSTASRSPPTA